MEERLENRNVAEIRPLPLPREVKARLPLTSDVAEVVLQARRTIRELLHGRDHRLLVIVGPCSIHDADAALDYAARLRRVAEATQSELVIVMRTYFEKPRTTLGWKGLINDPRLDGSCNVTAGMELARDVLLGINRLGLPCGGELLDPITPQYVADLLSWAAIGARTAESQTHREMASGLSMPIGFKNPTNGEVEAAVNATVAAAHRHTFLGIDSEGRASVVRTLGNPDCHIVLRGGRGRANYAAEDVARAGALLGSGAPRRPILIDCSHDNSGKDHTRQRTAWNAVLDQVQAGEARILGMLLESNLKAGRQTWRPDAPLDYGVSITDACIGWDETEELLHQTAAAIARTSTAAIEGRVLTL